MTWTTQNDFENATRQNIDTTTVPHSVMIGMSQDMPSIPTITITAGDNIYTTGVGRKSIAVIDKTSNQKTLISLAAEPSGVVYSPYSHNLYVGHLGENKVSIINNADQNNVSQSNLNLTPLEVGNGAYVTAYNSFDQKVYVSNLTDHSISIIPEVGGPITTLPLENTYPSPFTASYEPKVGEAGNKLYITNKFNNVVAILDGTTDQISTIEIEPVVGTMGCQAPGCIGLKASAPGPSNKMYLSWDYEGVTAKRKIELQVRTADDLITLDSASYHGPEPDQWYESDPGSTTTTVDLGIEHAAAIEVQARLSSDDLISPVLKEVRVLYESLPDLAVSVAPPATANTEQTITVPVTVTNPGLETAGPFTVNLYFSNNDYPNIAGETALSSVTVNSLAPGAPQTINFTVTIPIVDSATYYFKAFADSLNQVTEPNDDNNIAVSPISITRLYPDLTINNGVITAPSSAFTGQVINVSTIIKNQGQGTASPFCIGFYFSANNDTSTTRIPSDTPVGTCYSVVNGLAPGATASVNIPITVPVGKSNGTYFIKAFADNQDIVPESNESNNIAASGSITVSNMPDLVISTLTNPPTAANTGEVITVPVRVTNQGQITVPSSFYITVKFFTDSTMTQMVGSLPGYLVSGTLAPDGHKDVNVTGAVPVLNTGTYYLAITVDNNNLILESNENNNSVGSFPIAITRLYPDLVISTTTNPPTAANTGEVITVPVRVTNQGQTTVPSNFYITVKFFTDSTMTQMVGSLPGYLVSGTLAPDDHKDVNVTGAVPVLNTGTYYLAITVDNNNLILESNENNNSVGSFPIDITHS